MLYWVFKISNYKCSSEATSILWIQNIHGDWENYEIRHLKSFVSLWEVDLSLIRARMMLKQLQLFLITGELLLKNVK